MTRETFLNRINKHLNTAVNSVKEAKRDIADTLDNEYGADNYIDKMDELNKKLALAYGVRKFWNSQLQYIENTNEERIYNSRYFIMKNIHSTARGDNKGSFSDEMHRLITIGQNSQTSIMFDYMAEFIEEYQNK